MVTKIRIHGRGGQGVVLASELLSTAAFTEDPDRFVRSFGVFGVERRGSPVTAYGMVGQEAEMTRGRIYEPDIVVVLDPFLHKHVDITAGFASGGTMIMNVPDDTTVELDPGTDEFTLATIDATEIATSVLGRPIPNTVILGALAGATGLFSLDSLASAIDETFDAPLAAPNREAAEQGYTDVSIQDRPTTVVD